MFVAVLLVASLVCFVISWVADDDDRGLRVLASISGALFVSLATVLLNEGTTRSVKRLDNNGIYEVVGAAPISPDEKWLVLRDQDGECLTYSWKGPAPSGIVKAVHRSGVKETENYYDLIPFPAPATQPAK